MIKDDTRFYLYFSFFVIFYLFIKYFIGVRINIYNSFMFFLYSYTTICIVIIYKLDILFYNCLPFPGLICMAKEYERLT